MWTVGSYIFLVLGEQERVPHAQARDYGEDGIDAAEHGPHHEHLPQLRVNGEHREVLP